MDIKLHYFSGRGIGEPIRLTFVAANIAFDDKRYPLADSSWRNNLKNKLPFGQLPALEVDGVFIAQADSCARLAARLAKLYPEDPIMAAESDMIVVHQAEIQKAITRLSYDGVPGATGTTMVPEDRRSMLIDQWFETALPGFLSRLEHCCASPFMVGGTITWADINVFVRLTQLLDIQPSVLDRDYPKLKFLEDHVRSLPLVAKWMKAHQEDYPRA
jgi:glutathione S-transferase